MGKILLLDGVVRRVNLDDSIDTDPKIYHILQSVPITVDDNDVTISHLQNNAVNSVCNADENGEVLAEYVVPKEDEHNNDEPFRMRRQEDIKAILEENSRFKSNTTATRFTIANENKKQPLDEEGGIFRAYAVRRIVGGMETSISMYPYNVGICRHGRHWCGGSIIDEQWVLTAGHCFESAYDGDKRKLLAFIIRAGSSFHDRGGYQARVNRAFFPEKYSPGNADFDFSLIRLDRPMPIGRNIAVLNLPAKDYVIKPGDMLIVTGWGSTDETGSGHIPDRIRFVPVPAMRLSECQAAYRFYITPRMMCAGYATGGKDACNHDSGGPAVRDGVLLGIVSFGGKHCGDPRSPGVYSRVSEVTFWVENTVTNNEAGTVPELQEKIKRARERERSLQRFKARVEDKKNKIKDWLRETLKSPQFLELAKKKLVEAQAMRRSFTDSLIEPEQNASDMDDRTMDDINLSNMIHDTILKGDDDDEDDMLRTLALKDIMMNEGKAEHAKDSFEQLLAFVDREDVAPPMKS